ncbi:MAG: hypothetical protein VXZ55_09435, partial [Planctomycetota bacterium]|nr:hypothetical protein [Planctomycetota bacterium]
RGMTKKARVAPKSNSGYIPPWESFTRLGWPLPRQLLGNRQSLTQDFDLLAFYSCKNSQNTHMIPHEDSAALLGTHSRDPDWRTRGTSNAYENRNPWHVKNRTR